MTAAKQGGLALGVSAVLASALLSGCSPSDDGTNSVSSVGVCQDSHTHKRLPDANCQHTNHAAGMNPAWVYYGMGHQVPAVGAVGSGYSTTTPKGDYSRGGFSTKGGSSSKYGSLLAKGASVFGGSDSGAHAGVARGGFGGGEGAHGG